MFLLDKSRKIYTYNEIIFFFESRERGTRNVSVE
jgi:hypothetical protein